MYLLKYTSKFKKDLKRYKNKRDILNDLEQVLDLLAANKKLPEKYRNHLLFGEFKHCHECHIRPDILLIYRVDKKEIEILMVRLGSHSELFG